MPSSPSSARIPKPPPDALPPLWSMQVAARPRGLVLAREKGWFLAWDENNWLYLLNRKGERQAQMHSPGTLTAACAADVGSGYAALGNRGEVWWLAPDLMARWQRSVPFPPLAAAFDPFGEHLAVADARANLYLFDHRGRRLWQVKTPRPLYHLAFVPEQPRLIGCADFGLVACFDARGECVWRDGLVAHMGALAVSGDGSRIVLACFTDGLRFYSLTGEKQGSLPLAEPCRLAALTYDGRCTLVGGLNHRLFLLDRDGQVLTSSQMDKPMTALSLDALGGSAAVALGDGRILGLDLRGALPR